MKKKTIGWIAVAIVLAVGGGIAYKTQTGGVIPGLEKGVTLEKAIKQDITSSLTANGTLKETNSHDVYLDTPVRVVRILADKDAMVKQGDPVLEVDLTDLTSQLEQAKINRDIQALSVERAKSIDSSQSSETAALSVQQAESMLASDQASLARAKADYEKNKALYDVGSLSKTDLDRFDRAWQDLQTKVSQSQLSVSTAKANLNSAKKNNSNSGQSRSIDIRTQEGMLKLREQAVRDLEAKMAKIKAGVLSPLTGTITVMNASEGANVSTVQAVYRVSDLSALEVKADVKEFDSRSLKKGQKVEITGDGIDERTTVTGIITEMGSIATITRTATGDETVVGITVSVDQTGESLRPGLTVTCKVITDTKKAVPVIRYAMLSEDADGKTIVFVWKDGVVKQVPVTTGITSDLNVEVLTGLTGEELVVVNPPKLLKDGMKVERAEAK